MQQVCTTLEGYFPTTHPTGRGDFAPHGSAPVFLALPHVCFLFLPLHAGHSEVLRWPRPLASGGGMLLGGLRSACASEGWSLARPGHLPPFWYYFTSCKGYYFLRFAALVCLFFFPTWCNMPGATPVQLMAHKELKTFIQQLGATPDQLRGSFRQAQPPEQR